jgi:hypothetical protein
MPNHKSKTKFAKSSIKKAEKKAVKQVEKKIKKKISKQPVKFATMKGHGSYSSTFGKIAHAVGSGIGGLADGAKSIFKVLTGSGDYKTRAIALTKHYRENGLGSAVVAHMNVSNPGSLSMGQVGMTFDGKGDNHHREYICDIMGNTNNTPLITTYDINMLNNSLFPWASGPNSWYQETLYKSLIFEYVERSSNYSAGGNLGSVSLCTNYNPDQAPYTTMQEVNNSDFTTTDTPDNSFLHPIELGKNEAITRTKLNYLAAGEPEIMRSVGKLHVATVGNSSTSKIGELWAIFKVDPLIAYSHASPGSGDTFIAYTGALTSGTSPSSGNWTIEPTNSPACSKMCVTANIVYPNQCFDIWNIPYGNWQISVSYVFSTTVSLTRGVIIFGYNENGVSTSAVAGLQVYNGDNDVVIATGSAGSQWTNITNSPATNPMLLLNASWQTQANPQVIATPENYLSCQFTGTALVVQIPAWTGGGTVGISVMMSRIGSSILNEGVQLTKNEKRILALEKMVHSMTAQPKKILPQLGYSNTTNFVLDDTQLNCYDCSHSIKVQLLAHDDNNGEPCVLCKPCYLARHPSSDLALAAVGAAAAFKMEDECKQGCCIGASCGCDCRNCHNAPDTPIKVEQKDFSSSSDSNLPLKYTTEKLLQIRDGMLEEASSIDLTASYISRVGEALGVRKSNSSKK